LDKIKEKQLEHLKLTAMKIVSTLFIFIIIIITACSNPVHVTTTTDPQATTSGTLGAVRAENQLPRRAVDSVKTVDTTRIKREGRKAD
jgi:hypothetical protein